MRRAIVLVSFATGGAIGLGACGSGTGGSGGTSGASADGSAGSGGSQAGAGGAGARAGTAGVGGYVGCPASAPREGDACDQAGRHCTYGDDPRFTCRTEATCAQTWSVTSPAAHCAEPPLPPSCPASPQSGSCDTGLDCLYDDGTRCLCTDCPPSAPVCMSGPLSWHCISPPGGACPPTAPNAGTRCDLPADARCDYTCDLQARCEDGAWTWTRGLCPVCAAPDTPIATPDGERPIAEIRPGDLVYSVDGPSIDAVPVKQIGRAPVRGHTVVEVVLRGGATLHVSARHPTADGRSFGDLSPGDWLGSIAVERVSVVPYTRSHTFDILPASDTGTYFAAGALVGSTLARHRR